MRPEKLKLHLRSATSGRERWDVGAILDKADRARQLEQWVAMHPKVRQAKANAKSGRVLVVFDPTPPKLKVDVLLRDAVRRLSDAPGSPPDGSSRRQDLYYIVKTSLPERRHLAGALFFSVLSFTIHFWEGLFVVSTIKTRGKIAPTEAGQPESKPLRLSAVAMISVVLNAADTWARYERLKRWKHIGYAAQQKLRTRLIARLTEHDLAFFDTHSTGRMLNLVTDDAARIGEFIGEGCEKAVDKALTVIVSAWNLIEASPRLAALTCIPLLPLVILPRFLGKKISDVYARRGDRTAHFSQEVENTLSGIVDIKSFTAEHEERRRLHAADEALAEASKEAGDLWALQTGIGRGIYSIGMSINSAYGGDLLAKGKLSQTKYLRAVYMLPRFLDAVDGMAEVGRMYQGACDSAVRIRRVLDDKPKIRGGRLRLSREEFRGEVTFDNVTFGYSPSRKVLHNVSFDLRPGESLGIVGRTGSGKSTLLRLLMRFYDVEEGRILVDGRDIRDFRLKDLRSSIGLVSQDVYLFQGTVRDNVLYGQPGASNSEVMEALQEAGAEELLQMLPGALHAQVGERGRRLSGGERQRVAIARALLKRAPVLALDEVTSQLDYETEALVQRSVRRITANRSLITVAHRLSTVRDSDKILVLENGRIQEIGKHDELIAQNGIYASLWRLQTGEIYT